MTSKASKAERERRALFDLLTKGGFFPARPEHRVIYAYSSPGELPLVALPEDIRVPLRSSEELLPMRAPRAKTSKKAKRKLETKAIRHK